MALPKQHRLRRSQDFTAVYRRGRKAVSRHLVMRILPSSSPDPLPTNFQSSQFGIAVSQKVSKRAVVRNRLKRQLQAALRELLPRLKAGLKVVINVRPSAVACEYCEFLRELEQLFVELEVIDGHS